MIESDLTSVRGAVSFSCAYPHFHDFTVGRDCSWIMVNESVTDGVLLITYLVNANLWNTQHKLLHRLVWVLMSLWFIC